MSRDGIIQAISDHNVVEFSYKREVRKAEPHLLGINSTGALTLSAWQVTGRVGWRAYSVDKIVGFRITEKKFIETRPGYNPNDSTMSQIIHRY